MYIIYDPTPVLAICVPVAQRSCALRAEHFQDKWKPVFRPKMRQTEEVRAYAASLETEYAEAVYAKSDALLVPL